MHLLAIRLKRCADGMRDGQNCAPLGCGLCCRWKQRTATRRIEACTSPISQHVTEMQRMGGLDGVGERSTCVAVDLWAQWSIPK